MIDTVESKRADGAKERAAHGEKAGGASAVRRGPGITWARNCVCLCSAVCLTVWVCASVGGWLGSAPAPFSGAFMDRFPAFTVVIGIYLMFLGAMELTHIAVGLILRLAAPVARAIDKRIGGDAA